MSNSTYHDQLWEISQLLQLPAGSWGLEPVDIEYSVDEEIALKFSESKKKFRKELVNAIPGHGGFEAILEEVGKSLDRKLRRMETGACPFVRGLELEKGQTFKKEICSRLQTSTIKPALDWFMERTAKHDGLPATSLSIALHHMSVHASNVLELSELQKQKPALETEGFSI